MKITIVRGDYWDGLYLDGKLVWQHHTLRFDDFFEALRDHGVKQLNVDDFSTFGLDDDLVNYLNEVGTLPPNLDDILHGKWFDK